MAGVNAAISGDIGMRQRRNQGGMRERRGDSTLTAEEERDQRGGGCFALEKESWKTEQILGGEQLVGTLSAHGSGRVGSWAEWLLGLAFQDGPNRWHGAWAFKGDMGQQPTLSI
ncbi:hypothetical protein Salat_2918000 [Sesamum alatum]|uniref:Uncharacterized protein n=1 Tax=Sesamum alatum TaxID=300844 RepID=A0AAE1XJQ8_9LAMI|nr:hypothetical protein Salat_2918000 [Sesamum alatum]